MAENLTTIELLGISFTIRTQEDPAYIGDVIAYYRKRLDETAARIAITDPLKVSVLVALNVVDELFKERVANGAAAEDARHAGEITTRLIAQIDRALDPEPPGQEPARDDQHPPPPR
jgi:cell division protein ZapA (FtsZ GTPase activity inhibitor)